MKQLTCKAMGGPCDDMISGSSVEELTANGMKHLEEKHPEMVAQMASATPEDKQKWNDDIKAKFDAEPEM